MAFLVGASAPLAIQRLAIPAVSILIAFLGYGSQYLFAVSPDLLPGPLSQGQQWLFNALLLCLWWTYFQACTVDPGRYTFPPEKSAGKKNQPRERDNGGGNDSSSDDEDDEDHNNDKSNTTTTKNNSSSSKKDGRGYRKQKWCKKCRRPKPPRAHHCKTCARCIPRMDHHCPWTSNCVSLQTFPHFLRFLAYANLALWYLLRLLGQRFLALWSSRLLPAYLGPSPAQLVALTVFAFAAGVTSLALGILLATTLKGWLFNTTMIEGWEIERHEAVLERRAGNGGGDGDSFWPDSRGRGRGRGGEDDDSHDDMPVDAVEFPYDIGFWDNLCAGMGTRNFLLWFFPLAGHPSVAENKDGKMRGAGWEYEENGMNDAEGMWPPPDPAKTRHTKVWRQRRREMEEERERFEDEGRWARPEDRREAFRQRQQQDLRRWEGRILGELEETDDDGYQVVDDAYATGGIVVDEGKSGWVNAEGEHLGDFGVDSDAEYDDLEDGHMVLDKEDEEDDVPLGELIRRRKILTNDREDA
ncbi:hypothetical protein TruAng_010408 [Truncatella angustata]|nr:hypothetical protein TruAng_010408 [Truncatella angustata]